MCKNYYQGLYIKKFITNSHLDDFIVFEYFIVKNAGLCQSLRRSKYIVCFSLHIIVNVRFITLI